MFNKDDNNGSQDNEELHGLLFIGSFRNIKYELDENLNLVCNRFWSSVKSEEPISKECFFEEKVNLLESFSVNRNECLLNKLRNNYQLIELKQKNNDVVGIAKLPLHQFFIAFKDSEITNRLFKEMMPVISTDDWIRVIHPTSNDCCGYLRSVLAMGTKLQIDKLKEKYGLTSTLTDSNDNKKSPLNVSNVKISKNIPIENHTVKSKFSKTTDHLGNFIENLLQQHSMNIKQKDKDKNVENPVTDINLQQQGQQVQTRKTSDLLDTLNKALSTPPNQLDMVSLCFNQLNNSTIEIPKACKTLIEIERAVDLPKYAMKIGSKKISKKSPNSKKRQSKLFMTEEEPSAYTTFHASAGYGQMVKSHEGFVYATDVIEKNCNPVWGKKFEVPVPIELFTNKEKRFILKVWRKISTAESGQNRFQPLPMEDVVIGFLSIDLNSLSENSKIDEWYNIQDHNGRIHGRIKLKIKAIDNLNNIKHQLEQIRSRNLYFPTNGSNNIDFNNTPLSRAIKRKFTELEEITERLKARLLGVTGDINDNNNDNGIDNSSGKDCINDDPILEAQLDEFEHDLNTACDEDEEYDIENGYNWSEEAQKLENFSNNFNVGNDNNIPSIINNIQKNSAELKTEE